MNPDNQFVQFAAGDRVDTRIRHYFPAIICLECDSPIDALVALCVPRAEAMDLVAAAWAGDESACLLATVDGGRMVAALRTSAGRWAACNAFLDKTFTTHDAAARELKKLLKRGRRGQIGSVRVTAL